MAKIHEVSLDFNQNLESYLQKEFPWVHDYRVLSRNLDARGASRGKKPRYSYRIEIIAKNESFGFAPEIFQKKEKIDPIPLIIGMGPAGLFCALRMAEYGVPSIILERGDAISTRIGKVAAFWKKGSLDSDSNVCFGAGGSGLFSDGKLTTRSKSPYVGYVMRKFVELGAPAETEWIANPHLGSNKMRALMQKTTQFLNQKGVEIRYRSKVIDLIVNHNRIEGVLLDDGTKLFSSHVILATGHSARDVYSFLNRHNVSLEAKDFAIGVRIEHGRDIIDKLQYGDFAGDPLLGAARYRLTHHDQKTKRGTFSFCMCPGGYVLSAGTEANGLVTNGMSNYGCPGRFSNAAIVVAVKAGVDFPNDAFSAIKFQQEIETSAYQLSCDRASGFEVPAQKLKDFLENRQSSSLPRRTSLVQMFSADLSHLFPGFINESLKIAFTDFDRKMKGYINDRAMMFAPETRTSSPVRIVRNGDSLQSEDVPGLYPCGEGAGVAGGIVSAAVDGVRVAMAILQSRK